MVVKDLISIVTPMYNGEKYIVQTIESVIGQTYNDWEMIIVDDGSKDHSPLIVEEYSQKDGRIKLYRQVNAGSAAARNNGLRHSQGQYICFLDADDVLDCTFLEKQLCFLREKDAGIVYA